MSNIILFLFIFSFILIILIVLQSYLVKSTHRWLSFLLPALSFLFSLYILITALHGIWAVRPGHYVEYKNGRVISETTISREMPVGHSIFVIIFIFLFLNIPTLIEIIIYLTSKKQGFMKKMKVHDL